MILNDNNGNNVTLSPAFNPDTLNYTASVDNIIDSVTPVITHDNGANVNINGNLDLTEDENNTVTIRVTAQDFISETIYTITVYRGPDTNAKLSSLTIKDENENVIQLSEQFSSLIYSYTYSVSENTENVTISYEKSDEHSSVVISGGNNLIQGGNSTITITVTAQDGVTTQNYTIIVARAPSSDATLSALTLSDSNDQNVPFSPEFDSNINYTTTVSNTINLVNVAATSTANNVNNISGITNVSLTEGGYFNIDVVVTAQDGTTTKTYTITVYRTPSDDSKLTNIVLTDSYNNNVLLLLENDNVIQFNESILQYNAIVK